MFSYTYHHRVRYRECDPMNLVYHTHYVDYFEYARTEALRHLGISYRALEESGVIMPVIDLAVKYRVPAFYDDLLHVTARFAEHPGIRVPIDYEISRAGSADLLVTGRVTLCFVDRKRNRPIPAPPAIRDLFQKAIDENLSVSNP